MTCPRPTASKSQSWDWHAWCLDPFSLGGAIWTLEREKWQQKPLLPAHLLAGVLFPDQGPKRPWANGSPTSWQERRSGPGGLSTPPSILFRCRKNGVNGPHTPPLSHSTSHAGQGRPFLLRRTSAFP